MSAASGSEVGHWRMSLLRGGGPLDSRVLPAMKSTAGGRAKGRQPCIVKNGVYMVKTLTRRLQVDTVEFRWVRVDRHRRPWRLSDDDRRRSATVRDSGFHLGFQHLGLDFQGSSYRGSGRRPAAGYRTDGTAAATARSIRAWSRPDPRDWRLPVLCGRTRKSYWRRRRACR